MSEHPNKPNRSRRTRKLAFENLETRRLMATLPYGAQSDDLAEFMIGRIAVTPVFLESDGSIDPSTQDWTAAHVASVMSNIQTGLNWWSQLLAKQSSIHTLDWVIDRTYVDNRPSTPYEPIGRVSNAYSLWVSDFLSKSGFSQSSDLETNMRAFNQSQREKLNTDWSFTIFVVDAVSDSDGSFAPGGSFSRAFSFAGGLFEVVPSTRPASTFAHETGHEFWARDEYSGGGNYYMHRGYYDAQNTNAIDLNPNATFQQEPSIMSSGSTLQTAYDQVISSAATLAQIGWQDSDHDGIFDVLDVPLKLEGTGRFDSDAMTYNFVGTAQAQALPNRNSSGLQNNITLNKVGRIEYRLNGGNWTTLSTPNGYTANLSFQIPVQTLTGTIEIRAVDQKTGVTSNVFTGTLGEIPDITTRPGIQGFAWNDKDRSRTWTSDETGFAGATVTLVDANNQPVVLQKKVEPDDYPSGNLSGNNNGARIDAIGDNTNGTVGVFEDTAASTGTKIFKPNALGQDQFVDTFYDSAQQLRVRFDTPTSYVAIDAIAPADDTKVRLDAYKSDGTLVKRFERTGLLNGNKVNMEVGTPDAVISYVIARAYHGSYAKFDNLRFGPKNSTTTASDGSFIIESLPAGNYFLKIASTKAGFTTTSPSNGVLNVAYSTSTTVSHVDFGVALDRSPWQNPTQAEDVDNDHTVSPLDVLVLINNINAQGSRPLDNDPQNTAPYYDVDGDRALSPLDVLILINYINRGGNSGGSGGSGEGEDAAPQVVVNSIHGSSRPVLSSFATDVTPDQLTSRIVHSNSSAYHWKSQGPERCGCPNCISWDLATVQAQDASSRKSFVAQPTLSDNFKNKLSLDAYFAEYGLS